MLDVKIKAPQLRPLRNGFPSARSVKSITVLSTIAGLTSSPFPVQRADIEHWRERYRLSLHSSLPAIIVRLSVSPSSFAGLPLCQPPRCNIALSKLLFRLAIIQLRQVRRQALKSFASR